MKFRYILWIILVALIGILVAREFAHAEDSLLYSFDSGTSFQYAITKIYSAPDGSFLFHLWNPDQEGYVNSIDFKLSRHTDITYPLYVTIDDTEYEIPYTDVSTSMATTTVTLNTPIYFNTDDETQIGLYFYVKTSPSLTKYYRIQAYLTNIYSEYNSELWYINASGLQKTNGAIHSIYWGNFITSIPFADYWMYPLIPYAFASTSCEFVTNGATTTAECSDAQIENVTQNIATGIFIFLMVFFGLITYFRSKGGD